MLRLTDAGVPVQVAMVLAIALVAAPVVRTATAEFNDTVGRAWPFSLARCHVGATPGYLDRWPPSAAGHLIQHVRTGRL